MLSCGRNDETFKTLGGLFDGSGCGLDAVYESGPEGRLSRLLPSRLRQTRANNIQTGSKRSQYSMLFEVLVGDVRMYFQDRR